MSGFNGTGYVKLSEKGAVISWYLENDGAEGAVDLSIRYNAKINEASSVYVKVKGNDEVIYKKFLFPIPIAKERGWFNVKIPIKINRGANTIVLEALEDKELLVDEISFN